MYGLWLLQIHLPVRKINAHSVHFPIAIQYIEMKLRTDDLYLQLRSGEYNFGMDEICALHLRVKYTRDDEILRITIRNQVKIGLPEGLDFTDCGQTPLGGQQS
jgi:hypothetical protein